MVVIYYIKKDDEENKPIRTVYGADRVPRVGEYINSVYDDNKKCIDVRGLVGHVESSVGLSGESLVSVIIRPNWRMI